MSSQSQVLLVAALLLANPVSAVTYLSIPYIVMLIMDIQAKRRKKRRATCTRERTKKTRASGKAGSCA